MKITQFLKFEPILKEKIWGGEKLMQLLAKKSNKNNIGESWEISDVDNDTSIVANGSLKGTDLKTLISQFKGEIVGEKNYSVFGEKFPLLIKFIDAKEALSIQLHPNDTLAKKRHNSFGKTEMWYVVQADKNANLIVGFKKESNKQEYLKHLENKTLLEILNVEEVSEGDVYYISTGRAHAIGAGVLLAEIQQTSDITYRIYDWDRTDSDGKKRDLHTEEALNAIDYSAEKSYKTTYQKEENIASKIISCPYFTTNIVLVTKEILVNHSDKDSFVIYMCVKGAVTFIHNKNEAILNFGETILVPASFKEFVIKPSGNSELLEIFI
ncbi:type I phosphomannose isomerase catalytic subunit [Polaribacter uvawellassae]|uniref:type I phosphomannose isomerase catalytic subunit n=1 Tax=Polaribacter uvawellassae TaxID=3133495 RepID=UPI00321AA279